MNDNSEETSQSVVSLVTTRSEADIATDIKARVDAALAPVCALMDEAQRAGLIVQYDGIAPTPPAFRFRVVNLRVVKIY